MIDEVSDNLLREIADLYDVPFGAYNIRKNGKLVTRNVTANIDIVSKKDKDGIDIIIKPNTKNESVHIPVILTAGDFSDLVYNDFYVGDNSEVTIVAGCGIHNPSEKTSEHDGIHSFHIGKNAKVKYIEKHLGLGNGTGKRNLSPTTIVEVGEGSNFEMQTLQLGGVSFAERKTEAVVGKNATLIINEKILTTDNESASTFFTVDLKGENSKVEVLSRAVAKDKSLQSFNSNIVGNNVCFGHVECDGILSGNATIESTPKLLAKNVDAELSHEAALGKIAMDQIIKLETLGLTHDEAEKKIIDGFLS